MERATLGQYLIMADIHIETAYKRVESQARIVTKIKAEGRNATMAEQLLEQFQRSLDCSVADRELILRCLDQISG